MRAIPTPAFLALGLAIATSALGAGSAVAQTAPATPPAATSAPAAQDAADVKQIALTQPLVDQYIAAKKEMDAALDKLPDGADQPDPATLAKLDIVAKKYKFDNYQQYDTTDTNIGIVMAGIDPATKQYIGSDAVIKKQIAAVEADKQISAKDKKDTVDQLNAAMATVPKLQYPDNVGVVVKNFDKLNESMPQD